MSESKLRPKVVLWWGIGLTLAGVLLTILVPQIGYAAIVQQDYSAPNVDQALLVLLDLVVRIIGQVLIPLGVALIGASVVMAHVSRELTARAPVADSRPVDL
ncbi:hypothetical protein [Leifsonia sp. LS-T14]|uniref:hypothetical protein n=1 Tax=unclassified Leifsonia TaxID=2663824 RepID=UPI0035A6A699